MNSGIILGLTAALCWGTADFLARGAARAVGTFVALLYLQVVAVVGLLALGLPLGLLSMPHASPGIVLVAAVTNLAILGGAALLYRAFAIGTLALTSPIAASFGAITALLAILTGERPNAPQLVGIVLTLGGVILASAVSSTPEPVASSDYLDAKTRQRRLAPGLVEALGAMVVFGVAYWALHFSVARLGGIPTVFIGKVSDMVVLWALALAVTVLTLRRRACPDTGLARWALRRPPNGFWAFLVPMAILDTGANVAYNVGISGSLVSVVSVLSSLFSAVTVVLAWIFLGERLARWQWVGVGSIFVGIALVSM